MTPRMESHWTRRLETTVPNRPEEIVHQVLDGEAVLYDARTGSTHRLNETALAVWQACDGQATTRELAQWLTGVYDVSSETALEDVEQLIAAFAQAGLVRHRAGIT